MNKPVARSSSRPIMIAASPSNVLEKRIVALEEKVAALLARPTAPARTPPILDESLEQALEARLAALADAVEAAAAQRAIAALEPKVDEVVAAKTKNARSPVDPRTLVELVDQRLKEALEHRFRAMTAHFESDVIPRVLKKHASGI